MGYFLPHTVDKIMQSISNVYVSHLILCLRCKFHGNIPNDCQDIANLLLGYFNLGHPVYDMWLPICLLGFKLLASSMHLFVNFMCGSPA